MFKPLFTENAHYNNDALEISIEVGALLRPFFQRGYSPREMYALISLEASMEMSGKMIEDGVRRYKARKVIEGETDA